MQYVHGSTEYTMRIPYYDKSPPFPDTHPVLFPDPTDLMKPCCQYIMTEANKHNFKCSSMYLRRCCKLKMHHEELGQPLHFIVRSIVVHDGMYELSLIGKRGRVVSR